MSKVIRIISASVMLTVLSAIILAGCGNRHSDKAGLNKSDITETLSQTLESEKDSQMNSRSEENTDTEITDTEAEDSGQVDSEDGSQEETSNPYIIVREPYTGVPVYEDMEHIYMNTTWEYADHSAISDGYAVLYKAAGERKNIIIGVNAGHGTAGGSSVRTLCRRTANRNRSLPRGGCIDKYIFYGVSPCLSSLAHGSGKAPTAVGAFFGIGQMRSSRRSAMSAASVTPA